MNYHL